MTLHLVRPSAGAAPRGGNRFHPSHFFYLFGILSILLENWWRMAFDCRADSVAFRLLSHAAARRPSATVSTCHRARSGPVPLFGLIRSALPFLSGETVQMFTPTLYALTTQTPYTSWVDSQFIAAR
ncbi:unnamed protein product, partial [Phaeothamnion confervicola]